MRLQRNDSRAQKRNAICRAVYTGNAGGRRGVDEARGVDAINAIGNRYLIYSYNFLRAARAIRKSCIT